jgi:hypothetical protein
MNEEARDGNAPTVNSGSNQYQPASHWSARSYAQRSSGKFLSMPGSCRQLVSQTEPPTLICAIHADKNSVT